MGSRIAKTSNWYLNALAMPGVTLEIGGKKLEACVEKVALDNPHSLRQIMDTFARERPELYKDFFGLSGAVPPDDELLRIGKRVAFLRFIPQD